MNWKAFFCIVVGTIFSSVVEADSYFDLEYVQTKFPGNCDGSNYYQYADDNCSSSENSHRLAFGTMLKEIYYLEAGYYDSGEHPEIVDFTLGARLFRVGGAYVTTHLGYATWTLGPPDYCYNCGSHRESGRLYGFGIESRWLTFGYEVIQNVKYGADSSKDGGGSNRNVERIGIGVRIRF